jgi:hypothetical protein
MNLLGMRAESLSLVGTQRRRRNRFERLLRIEGLEYRRLLAATGTASISPITAEVGDAVTYTLVVNNTSSEGEEIASVEVELPAGIASVSNVTVAAEDPGNVDRTWEVDTTSPTIEVNRTGGNANDIDPGGTITITFTATASTTGAKEFTTSAFAGTQLTGEEFVLSGQQPTVTVNAGANTPPVVNDQTFNVIENAATGTVVGTVLATDADGDQLTYSITAGNTNGEFAINSTTGQITVANSAALNFETNASIPLTVQVSDGSATDTATVTINLTDVNEAPILNNQTFTVDPNAAIGTVVSTVQASDPEGDDLTFSITGGNTNGAFAINADTGVITVANSAALQAQSTFNLTVQASDGSLTDTATVTINVGANAPPVVNDQTFNVVENAANGTVVGTVLATDADGDQLTYSIIAGNTNGAFAINATTGQITVANSAALNFETNPSIPLTVQVSDGSATDTATVTINLTNVNEAPILNDQTFTVDPGAVNGTVVGTVQASDPEGDDLTFSITGGNTNGAFAINSDTGVITVANSAALQSQSTFNLTVQASDGSLADTATVTISVLQPQTEISVTVDANGKLLIEGTNNNDAVTITGVGVGTGVYTVTTQVGTQAVETQTVSGVIDICVFLHAGDDSLTMNNIFIRGSIVVEMDIGNDTVNLGLVDVVSTQGNLDVDLGTGNDLLNGRRIFIAGNQILAGGDGDDDLTFDGIASPFTLGTSAAGSASWTTGNGNDSVHVIYAFIVGAFTIDLGDGNDSLDIFGSAASGDVTFVGGAGLDNLRVDTNFFDADQVLDGGDDDDTVFLANGLGTDLGNIITGGGTDSVTVRNETQTQLNINTGSGADTVDMRASALDRFFAVLGDDNDTLTIFGNLIRIETDLDGGAGGSDRLLNLGNDLRGTVRQRNFELFS